VSQYKKANMAVLKGSKITSRHIDPSKIDQLNRRNPRYIHDCTLVNLGVSEINDNCLTSRVKSESAVE